MALPRYGRDRQRSHRYGAPGTRQINRFHLLAGGFFITYLIFLVMSWRYGNSSILEGSAPTEQLSSLRKVSKPTYVQNDGALKVAAQLEEMRKNKERAHQIPIKVVHPTPVTPTTAPVATMVAVKEPTIMQKLMSGGDPKDHVSRMPMQTLEAIAPPLKQEQDAEMAAATEQVVAEDFPEQIAPAVTLDSFAARHQEIHGYEAMTAFLESYQSSPDKPLFLFFMCSDEQFNANEWSEECTQGRKHVYDVFSKSPERNRLVTVFAGSERYWKHQNDFYNDQNLHVKSVPCIMKWEGRDGRTEGMLVNDSLFDEPFLRFLFRNTDQPEILFTAEAVKTKQIITVKGYNDFVDAMTKYEHEENPVPTFLMMVSGRFQTNNRPWCPYCRHSELPLEYAFFSYAPKNARMIRVEVAETFAEWRNRNEFTYDENLQLRTVPSMFHIEPMPAVTANSTNLIKFSPHKVRFDRLAPLREFFTSFA